MLGISHSNVARQNTPFFLLSRNQKQELEEIGQFSPLFGTPSPERENRNKNLKRKSDSFVNDPHKRVKRESPKNIKWITASEADRIRYSQLFISPQAMGGKSIEELTHDILRNGWDEEKQALQIVKMEDGKFTSLNNRRLFVLKNISKVNPNLRFPIEKLSCHVQADPLLINAINEYYKTMNENEANHVKQKVEKICKQKGIRPHTNGWAIISRMNQNDRNFIDYIHGSRASKIFQNQIQGYYDQPTIKTTQIVKNYHFSKRTLI